MARKIGVRRWKMGKETGRAPVVRKIEEQA